MMDDVLTAWRGGFVRRWHSNPDMADLIDEIAAHQGRCAILALKLFPDCSRYLLEACVTHDAAEWYVGDIAYTRMDRTFAAALDKAEALALSDMGLGLVLTPDDRRRLKLIDRLDAYLFAKHRRPHVLTGDGWPEQREWLAQEWMDTGAAYRPKDVL
jgi:hypothetical protein